MISQYGLFFLMEKAQKAKGYKNSNIRYFSPNESMEEWDLLTI